MSTADLGVELEALAERIGRIRAVGNNGDADPFYVDRSQCKADTRALMQWQRSGHPPAGYILSADRVRDDERRTRYHQR